MSKKYYYEDIDVKETSFVNRVLGKVYLDNQDPIEVEAASKETEVKLSFLALRKWQNYLRTGCKSLKPKLTTFIAPKQ